MKLLSSYLYGIIIYLWQLFIKHQQCTQNFTHCVFISVVMFEGSYQSYIYKGQFVQVPFPLPACLFIVPLPRGLHMFSTTPIQFFLLRSHLRIHSKCIRTPCTCFQFSYVLFWYYSCIKPFFSHKSTLSSPYW